MIKGYQGKKFKRRKMRKTHSAFEILSEMPRLRRGVIFFCLTLFAILFFLGAKQFAKAQPRFKTDLAELKIIGGNIYWATGKAKTFIRNSFEETIKAKLPKGEDLSLIDSDLTGKVYQAFLDSPWVRDVWEIKKEYPASIHAKFELRKPVIGVLVEDKIVMLDEDSVILPLLFPWKVFQDFNHYLEPPLRIAVGINAELKIHNKKEIAVCTDNNQLLEAGEQWDDDRIVAAVSVNATLNVCKKEKMLSHLKFRTINISNVRGRKDRIASSIMLEVEVYKKDKKAAQVFNKLLNIVTIWWGRDKEHAGFGENTVSRKIKMLKSIVRKNPELKGISKIDLRFPVPFWAPIFKSFHD